MVCVTGPLILYLRSVIILNSLLILINKILLNSQTRNLILLKQGVGYSSPEYKTIPRKKNYSVARAAAQAAE